MLEIFSESELFEILSKRNYSKKVCISIGDPGTQINWKIKKSFLKVLRLEFFDVVEIDHSNEKLRIPQLKDVKKIVQFFQENKELDFVIHCNAGVGRSPAVGLILLFLLESSYHLAKTQLKKIRPKAMPNKLIIKLFDDLYQTKLLETNFEIWKERLIGIQEEIKRQKMVRI